MKSDDTVKRQWNEAAKSFIEFVRSGKNYYAEYLNGPALKQMVGNVKGKQVLDIGCGEGFLSRHFAKMGAQVTAVDISEALIEAAKEEEQRNPLGIRYIAADAANLNMLGDESFDIAYCHMALMDIEDYRAAIGEVSRVLRKGGRFAAVIEHPCFNTRAIDGKPVAGWETRLHDDGSKEYLYYRVESYQQRHRFISEWKHDRLPYSFVTTGFHRTLSDYVNTLTKHGLAITRFDEPQPMEEGVKLHPPMAKHYKVPQSLVIEATKIDIGN